MTPNFFCISDTSNSLSACIKNLKKFYRLENFRANVLNSPLFVNAGSGTVPLLWLSILDCLSQSRRTLAVILLDISPVLQTDFLFYLPLLSRIEKNFYYKLGRQIIQQIVEGAASNNHVYLQESETTRKCHTLFY